MSCQLENMLSNICSDDLNAAVRCFPAPGLATAEFSGGETLDEGGAPQGSILQIYAKGPCGTHGTGGVPRMPVTWMADSLEGKSMGN